MVVAFSFCGHHGSCSSSETTNQQKGSIMVWIFCLYYYRIEPWEKSLQIRKLCRKHFIILGVKNVRHLTAISWLKNGGRQGTSALQNRLCLPVEAEVVNVLPRIEESNSTTAVFPFPSKFVNCQNTGHSFDCRVEFVARIHC